MQREYRDFGEGYRVKIEWISRGKRRSWITNSLSDVFYAML